MEDSVSLLSVGWGVLIAILPLMFAGLLGSSWSEMTRLGRVGVGVSTAMLQAVCLYLFQSAGGTGWDTRTAIELVSSGRAHSSLMPVCIHVLLNTVKFIVRWVVM